MAFKRLTPDLGENIQAARRAAEESIRLANDLSAAIEIVQTNLGIIQNLGGKAEKLDYSIERIEHIRRELNGLSIGSLCAITLKHVLEELWQSIP